MITQIETNHGGFPSYFERFKIKPALQSSHLCGMRALVDGLYFVYFFEWLQDAKRVL